MSDPENLASPHLYPEAIQIKLYQAFIFSIPILFSIILFLLFYLFYLKRRASSLSSPSQMLPMPSNHPTPFISSTYEVGIKGEIKDKLPIVLFDEELKTKDSQCCVCLGDYEMKEELLQIPSCKHIFHVECIHHWLHTNSTCPLCRSSIVSNTKPLNHHQQLLQSPPSDSTTQQITMPIEASSSGSLDGAVVLHIQIQS